MDDNDKYLTSIHFSIGSSICWLHILHASELYELYNSKSSVLRYFENISNRQTSLHFDETYLDYCYYIDNKYYRFYYNECGILSKEMLDDVNFKFILSSNNYLKASRPYILDMTLNQTNALESGSYKYHKYPANNVGICGYDTSLTSAVFPDKIDRLSITAIEDKAFYNCRELQSVVISGAVEKIGKHAFYYDSELESVVIPYSVSNIDDYAFSGCTDLKDIYYNGSEKEWNAITFGVENECLLNANIHFNSTGPVNPTEPELLIGDVNNDGSFDISDEYAMQKWIVKSGGISNYEAADFNGDNVLDVFDVVSMKRSLIKEYHTSQIITAVTTVPVTTATTVKITTDAKATAEATTQAATKAMSQMTTKTTTKTTTKVTTKVPVNITVNVITTVNKADEYVKEIAKLVNEERAKKGITEVNINAILTDAAMLRAKEITKKFSHDRPDGSSCFSVFEDYNLSYSYCAENIAAGNSTPADTMRQWINSEGHYNNLMSPNVTEIGVGYCYDPNSEYKYYWVQLFRKL